MKTIREVAVVILAVSLIAPMFAACAGKIVRREAIDDLTITASVKTALLNEPTITAPRIDVDTKQGVVTLSGRVASKQEELKAIELARSVGGVVDVKSTLQIQQ
jgi:osmotically-inducible protein OsmY